MKIILITFSLISMLSFSKTENVTEEKQPEIEAVGSNFTLINDTKEKVSIYTGTGFVSLNKSSKTSIRCSVGKEVRWAEKGKKLDVIFKIESSHCGQTLKLSQVID